MVECLALDRGAAGSRLIGVTALCPWARHINPSFVLVQPRKTRPYITERLLMGRKIIKSNNADPDEIAFLYSFPKPTFLSELKQNHGQFHSIKWNIMASTADSDETLHIAVSLMGLLCLKVFYLWNVRHGWIHIAQDVILNQTLSTLHT